MKTDSAGGFVALRPLELNQAKCFFPVSVNNEIRISKTEIPGPDRFFMFRLRNDGLHF